MRWGRIFLSGVVYLSWGRDCNRPAVIGLSFACYIHGALEKNSVHFRHQSSSLLSKTTRGILRNWDRGVEWFKKEKENITPSFATDDRKQYQFLNVALNSKTWPLFLEFSWCEDSFSFSQRKHIMWNSLFECDDFISFKLHLSLTFTFDRVHRKRSTLIWTFALVLSDTI